MNDSLLDRCAAAYDDAILFAILRLEADQDEEPGETWDSHPSLAAEERNPTLK